MMDDAGSTGSPFGRSAVDAARHDHGRLHGQGWPKGAVSRVERSVCLHGVRAQTFALIVATSQVEANLVDRKVAAIRRKVGEASAMGSSSTLASLPFWHEVQVLWDGASQSMPYGGSMPVTASHARCTSPSCAARSQDRVPPPLLSPSRSRASARLDLRRSALTPCCSRATGHRCW